jgi:hypothetical protein
VFAHFAGGLRRGDTYQPGFCLIPWVHGRQDIGHPGTGFRGLPSRHACCHSPSRRFKIAIFNEICAAKCAGTHPHKASRIWRAGSQNVVSKKNGNDQEQTCSSYIPRNIQIGALFGFAQTGHRCYRSARTWNQCQLTDTIIDACWASLPSQSSWRAGSYGRWRF